jgi:hypothetical protein
VPRPSNSNGLVLQTSLSAHTDCKGFFGALTNQMRWAKLDCAGTLQTLVRTLSMSALRGIADLTRALASANDPKQTLSLRPEKRLQLSRERVAISAQSL